MRTYLKSIGTVRIVQDPQFADATANGRIRVNLRVLANPSGKPDTGEFLDAEYWYSQSSAALDSTLRSGLVRGAHIHITGQLKSRTYTDRNGVEREAWSLVITELTLAELAAEHLDAPVQHDARSAAPAAPAAPATPAFGGPAVPTFGNALPPAAQPPANSLPAPPVARSATSGVSPSLFLD